MHTSSALSLSPSFTSYSSSRLAEIAARVVEEFRDQDEVDETFSSFCVNVDGDDFGGKDFYEEFVNEREEERIHEKVEDNGVNGQEEDGDGDEEFEFAFVTRDSVSSLTPADEIFYNGQIRPIYPIFDTSLLFDGVGRGEENEYLNYNKSMHKPPPPQPPPVRETIRLPLGKLFIEEREASSSCSSSEADELEGVAPETYCVWNPKAADDEDSGATKGHCKKSNSTGSSKRWRFRDLLLRSSSDGKDRFVFLSHSNSRDGNDGKKREERVEKFDKMTAAAATAKVADKTMAAQQRRKIGGERRRESFLPYRQVGIFSNVNGLSKNLHPF